MSCRISPWRAKRRIDLFGVWRWRVSLGKCVNVSMSVRRGGCTVKQERNWTLKRAKSFVRWNRLHQKKKKKKATRQNKTTHGPRKSVEQGRLAQKQKKKKKKKKEKKKKKTFLSARHISACRRQNNSERVRGIKIKPLSVSDCFMNPCRSGGSTPHQTL